jgi:hypothetical protein
LCLIAAGTDIILPLNTVTKEYRAIELPCSSVRGNANWYFKERGSWVTAVDDGILEQEYWHILAYYRAENYHRLDIKSEAISKDVWKQYSCTPYGLSPSKHSAQLILIGEFIA